MEEWPKHYSPKEIEEKWQKIWLSEEMWKEVFRFKEEEKGKESFVIDTPPPFTSGELHMGHAYWVSIADCIARFRRIQGYNVLLPQGWDTQGLPTELKVQYKLRIPKENRELFLKKCVEWTEEMITKMKGAMIRLGYRPEWERFEYKTYETTYRKAVQRSLLDMFKAGKIEVRDGPVYWCPKCETALALSEVGYIEREGIIAHVNFPLKDGGYITIATTRPELIGATQAVAVNPEDERYKTLIGKTAIIPLFNKEVKIIAEESVEKDFGTGAEMISTYGDPQDIKVKLKHNLPSVEMIDERGRMKGTGIVDGLKVEEARKKIVQLLKEKGFLVKVENIKHNVIAHTERSDCMSPIEFLTKKQIYIKVLDDKQKLLEKYRSMKFMPQRMSYYLETWITSLEWDWDISRQRLYGTPIPFWYCKNNHLVPAKEEDLPIDPNNSPPPTDRCPICGEQLYPVKDVADVWIDSSISALYVSGYFTDKERFSRSFPVSIRLQGTDIIRTWLFYTFFRTLSLTGNVPFREVLVNGQVLGPDGTRMSKSKGNTVSPLDKIDEMGADAIRLTLLDASIGDDFPFKWEKVKAKKTMLQKLWNASRLLYPFLKENKVDLDKVRPENLIDKWILQEHKKFVLSSIAAYDRYDFYVVIQQFYDYFWEIIADEYLEMIKHRLFENDQVVLAIISKILKDLIVILHPIAPHITEEIYSRLYGDKKSVLLESLPDVSFIPDDNEALEKGKIIKRFSSMVRTSKVANKLAMPTPVDVKFYGDEKSVSVLREVEEDLKKTLKIEKIEYFNNNEEKVEISVHGS
ncbi:Isoleucine--tRNA ligase [Sulfuracidifex tepidarius]|uniref:Valine--tRNA ligase n=1 Tax=Sulfuracidifex tepidarius TaxID=1294262 RepID=A0A510DUD0_9CREN|nr:valine--tRNA ligase [Sulfuracidifex tepidarius]BBG23811.1 Isoleucine--tRNA ligase [Sulfuracidifex tepidarius]